MLRRLAALDGRRRVLVGAAFVWVLAARFALSASRGRSLPFQARLLGGLAGRLPALAACTVDDAVWAVTAAARRVPGTRCLAWSLALRTLLAQARIDGDLRIGVAAAAAGTIEAHAWVAVAGRDLTWGGDVARYSVLRPRTAAP
jgi:hypothetical protein